MKKILQTRRWLRWAALAPMVFLYESNGCVGIRALREVADGLNDAADTLSGDDDRSDFNRFIDDLQDLFD